MDQRSVLHVNNLEASFRRQAHITKQKNAELQRARRGDEGEVSKIGTDVESDSSVNDASSSDYAGSNQARLLDSGSDVDVNDGDVLFSDRSSSPGMEGDAGIAAMAAKRARRNQLLGRTRCLVGRGKGPMVGRHVRPKM